MNILEVIFYFSLIFLVLAVIAYLVITFTTGWKKTGRMDGGLYCITAPPSSGKSYVVTKMAIDHMRSGRRVFTNYPIHYNNGREKFTSLVLKRDMLLTYNFSGSVIIVDEAHQWWWSRNFKQFNDDFKNWFSSLAQREISLYYVVQHEDRVDTIINDCCNLFGEIEKVEIPVLEMPIYFRINWWVREIDMQLARTHKEIDPFHHETIWFDRDVAQSYNTKFFAHDKRPVYEGVDWLTYCSRHGSPYLGNYTFSLKSKILLVLSERYNKIAGKVYFMKQRANEFWKEVRERNDKDIEIDLAASGNTVNSGSSDIGVVSDDSPLLEDLFEEVPK